MAAQTTEFESLRELLPAERTRDGQTRVSQSLLEEWGTCEYLFYAERVAPHPSGAGTGLRERVDGDAPWIGKVFGMALEGWFRSGWRDGRYSADEAHNALFDATRAERDSAGFEDEWLRRCTAATTLLERYLERAGPDDYGLFEVVGVNGEPLIEQELEVPLTEGLSYSSRPDLVVRRRSDGMLCALDHKTASRVDTARLEMRIRPQLTGQQWAVQQVLGEPAGCLVNLIAKGTLKNGGLSKGVAPRLLEKVDRPAGRVELWLEHTINTARAIEGKLRLYRERCGRMPEPIAARLTFNDQPGGGACMRYNRPCRFLDQCAVGADVIGWHGAQSKARYEKEQG